MQNIMKAVMPPKESSMVNFVPTKENVDYLRIYLFNSNPNFGRFKANRELKKSHVKEILNTIETGEYKAKYIAPIRVDINTLNVIDGQHRNQAFIQAWDNESNEVMKVVFEDLPEDERKKLDIVRDINSTTSNWGITAYEHRLKEDGNEHMLNIASFGLSHPMCQKLNRKGEVKGYYPRYVYAILLGYNATKDVKNGSIMVTDQQLKFGEQMYKELEMLVNSLGYEMNSWFESFAHAWYNIRLNDKAYSSLIDSIGIETICKYILDIFSDFHPVTKRTTWENRFRNAVWTINERLKNKTL